MGSQPALDLWFPPLPAVVAAAWTPVLTIPFGHILGNLWPCLIENPSLQSQQLSDPAVAFRSGLGRSHQGLCFREAVLGLSLNTSLFVASQLLDLCGELDPELKAIITNCWQPTVEGSLSDDELLLF